VPGGEPGGQRLLAEPLYQIRLRLVLLEDKPRAETPHVAIGDIRFVV
jgi:hypothetical protein